MKSSLLILLRLAGNWDERAGRWFLSRLHIYLRQFLSISNMDSLTYLHFSSCPRIPRGFNKVFCWRKGVSGWDREPFDRESNFTALDAKVILWRYHSEANALSNMPRHLWEKNQCRVGFPAGWQRHHKFYSHTHTLYTYILCILMCIVYSIN